MEKRICAKFAKLTNVVGRVDYISNPKRQENLLGFYQTPEDPQFFWRALSDEAQDLAAYNKNQIEEHNRIEEERFKTGEIRKKDLWSTVEARENILCLPNELYGKVDPQKLAEFLAHDIKNRLGIECAVGVHMNKAKTNFHAHIIMPERTLLQEQRVSIATRNTYFNAEGKRSSKKECVDEVGNLKPGCRMVKKGENLNQRRFSEKDARFASKGFCYGEKKRYAALFNQLSKDHWVVYNHYTNPHMRLYNLKRGEPEGLRRWKEEENQKIRAYNATIDEMLKTGELTEDQALQLKQRLYEDRADQRRERERERQERVIRYVDSRYKNKAPTYSDIRYREDGTKRGMFDALIMLALLLANRDLNAYLETGEIIKDRRYERNSDHIAIAESKKLQAIIDGYYAAAGRKTPTELAAEARARRLANEVRQTSEGVNGTMQGNNSLLDLIGAAESQKTPRGSSEARGLRAEDDRRQPRAPTDLDDR